jgi:hypothetical protein
MNWLGIFAWGFWATAVMTIIESAGRWAGLTRMSTPVLLGTAITADRDRATFFGTLMHVAFGWIFAALYALTFLAAGAANWWLGLVLGIVHTLFMFGVVFPTLPAIHPHMASLRAPPDECRALQPPGFLALNYGRPTVLVSLVSHAAYGTLLGLLYQVPQ